MLRIGLVGEDPNDTSSVINLLTPKYRNKAQFTILARGIKGCNLDTEKFKRIVAFEFKDKRCDFIIYIRDLDAFRTQAPKVAEKVNWFKSLEVNTNDDGLLLLNIWELEALILSDIDTFNKIYKTNYQFNGDPTQQKSPKEILKNITFKSPKRFHESHCPDIFKKLDFDSVKKSCWYFKDFINELDKKI